MQNIVIIDDHPLIRSGLRDALVAAGFEVIAEAGSKSEALATLNKFQPEFCIVDLNLADGSGLEVIQATLKSMSDIKFIVLTMNDEEIQLEQAKSAGAIAYVLKSSPVDELIELIKSIANGVDKFRVVGSIRRTEKNKDFGLTNKEFEVLQLLGSGITASNMAKQLFLSEATVKTHLAAIYRKLSASNRAQALNIALANKLISD